MTARERLLKKRPRKIEIDGEEFQVRSLTIAEQIAVDGLSSAGKPQEAMQAILAASLLDDSGAPMFTGPDDPTINDIPMELVPRICEAVAALAKIRSIEKTEKNSDATP